VFDKPTLTDWITAFFAAASFMTSLVLLVRQLFWRREQLAVTTEAAIADASGYITVQFSVSNFGTHPVKLHDYMLTLRFKNQRGAYFPTAVMQSPISQVLIKPGEIVTRQVEFGVANLNDRKWLLDIFEKNLHEVRKTGLDFILNVRCMSLIGEWLSMDELVARASYTETSSGVSWEAFTLATAYIDNHAIKRFFSWFRSECETKPAGSIV
jgi:hypothetical protein